MLGSKNARRLAFMLTGAALCGSLLTGCGGDDKKTAENEIKVGANLELTGNVANYGTATFEGLLTRSEERRVGKECRSRWSPYH